MSGHLRRGRNGRGVATPAFPKKQLFILAMVRICEPIAFMSIFPYIYYMILSFNITSDDRQIAIYAGMVTSAFAFAEFSTGVLWGRLSDRIGRKPVLIGGLIGTALSMLMFGFATNLQMALIGRALGGLLNGNIGVLQTTVAEMVTVKEHQPRAYSIMPFVWCLGSILGPALGGALAQPCISYPSVFAEGGLFDRYPFLLPNLVCVVVLACGVTVGILFLEETHAEYKHRRDVGRVLGQWLLRRVQATWRRSVFGWRSGKSGSAEEEAHLQEVKSLLMEEDGPPEYRTNDNTPSTSRTPSPAKKPTSTSTPTPTPTPTPTATPKPASNRAFTKQVVLTIVSYGILAYHTMSFDQLMPVFLSSTPGADEEPELPFKFTGGFSLSTRTVGLMLSLAGAYSMFAQLFLFPRIVERFGTLGTFRFTIMTWPLLYLIVPYLSFLPKHLQVPGAFMCLIWRTTNQTLSYPSNAILLTNAAPSNLVLGLINGVAASCASLSRAFGPTIAGMIHSWALERGYVGISMWVSGLVCVVGAVESLFLREVKGRMDVQPDDEDEEAGLLPYPTEIEVAMKEVSTSDRLVDERI